MAAGLVRHLADHDPRFRTSPIEVRSAGTSARSGEGATPLAALVMTRRGIDLTRHRSTRLSSELITRSDVILTMTGDHRKAVLRLDPSARDRTFTLAEFAGGAGDVDDPMLKGTEAVYERCAEELSRLILRLLERLALPGQDGPR
jgi:protein-tyrosine-phosphatase